MAIITTSQATEPLNQTQANQPQGASLNAQAGARPLPSTARELLSAVVSIGGRTAAKSQNNDGSVSYTIPLNTNEAESPNLVRIGGNSTPINLKGLVRVENSEGIYKLEKVLKDGKSSLVITIPAGKQALEVAIGADRAKLPAPAGLASNGASHNAAAALGIPNAGNDGASTIANDPVRMAADKLQLRSPVTSDLNLKLNPDGSVAATIKDAGNGISFKWLNNDGVTQNNWEERQLVYSTGSVTNRIQRIWSPDQRGQDKYSVEVQPTGQEKVYQLNIKLSKEVTAIGLKTNGKEYLITRDTLEELQRQQQNTEASPSDLAPGTSGSGTSSVPKMRSAPPSLNSDDNNTPLILGAPRMRAAPASSVKLGLVEPSSAAIATDPVAPPKADVAATRTPKTSSVKADTTNNRVVKAAEIAPSQSEPKGELINSRETVTRPIGQEDYMKGFEEHAKHYNAQKAAGTATPEELASLRRNAESWARDADLTPEQIVEKLGPINQEGSTPKITQENRSIIVRPQSPEIQVKNTAPAQEGINFFTELKERIASEATRSANSELSEPANKPTIKRITAQDPGTITLRDSDPTQQPRLGKQPAIIDGEVVGQPATEPTTSAVNRAASSPSTSAESSVSSQQPAPLDQQQIERISRLKTDIRGSQWAKENPFKAVTALVTLSEAVTGYMKSDGDPDAKHSLAPSIIQQLVPNLANKTSWTTAELGDFAARLVDATRSGSDAAIALGAFAALDRGVTAAASTKAGLLVGGKAGAALGMRTLGVAGVAWHGYSSFASGEIADMDNMELAGTTAGPIVNGAIVGGAMGTAAFPVAGTAIGAGLGFGLGAASELYGLYAGNARIKQMIESSWQKKEVYEALRLADKGFLLPPDSEEVKNRKPLDPEHKAVLDELAKIHTLDRLINELSESEHQALGLATPAQSDDEKAKNDKYQQNFKRMEDLLNGRSYYNPVKLFKGDFLDEIAVNNPQLVSKFNQWHQDANQGYAQKFALSPQVELAIKGDKLEAKYALSEYISKTAGKIPANASDGDILKQLGEAFPDMDRLLKQSDAKSLLINGLEEANPALRSSGRIRKLLDLNLE